MPTASWKLHSTRPLLFSACFAGVAFYPACGSKALDEGALPEASTKAGAAAGGRDTEPTTPGGNAGKSTSAAGAANSAGAQSAGVGGRANSAGTGGGAGAGTTGLLPAGGTVATTAGGAMNANDGGASGASAESCTLAPAGELLFVLDTCDAFESAEPTLAEPLCAFRHEGCEWELQCGSEILRGEASPGANRVEWTFSSGTHCSAAFDATGELSGNCDTESACNIASKPAVPGGEGCSTLPEGTDFYSRGCAGGDPLNCRKALQHGCSFMALCSFSTRFPDEIFAGTASITASGRNRLEFNGIGTYDCSVEEALPQEIQSGTREAGEWFGQCVNDTGGQCRGELQLFFAPRP